jgi:hypothetical protein
LQISSQEIEYLEYWVEEHAQVQQGENVLFTYDDEMNFEQLREIKKITERKGATPIMMHVPNVELPAGVKGWTHVGAKYREVPAPILEAMRTADRIVDFSELCSDVRHNMAIYGIIHEYGKKIIANPPRRMPLSYTGDIRSKAIMYPRDLIRRIGLLTSTRIRNGILSGKKLRVTDKGGSDISFRVMPGNITQNGPIISEKEDKNRLRCWDSYHYPRSMVGCDGPYDCNGEIVTRYCQDLGGLLEVPLHMKVRDGWFEAFEGGEQARRLDEMMGDDRSNRRLQFIALGIHPKISIFGPNGRPYHPQGDAGAGNIHFAAGREEMTYVPDQLIPACSRHFGKFGYLPRVNFYIGDDLLVEDGKLAVLDDPALREYTRKFGDPDELLSHIDWPQKSPF